MLLGYAFGASARGVIDRAKGPAIAALLALAALGALVWFVRRRNRRGAIQAWTEACCPACLAIGVLAPNRMEDPAPVAAAAR